jgi:hypothetical protein
VLLRSDEDRSLGQIAELVPFVTVTFWVELVVPTAWLANQ